MPPTAFLMHPSAVLHDTGWGHPEHQGRLRALASAVKNDLVALHGRVVQVAPAAARVEDLALVHADALVGTVRGAVDEARERGRVAAIDADTRVSAASWEAALGTVGAALEAVRGVAEGRFCNAFVAARPPGHHATPDRAMGFCLFNNIAVAAASLRESGAAGRVLIVDWDVHHGNGTQDAFYDDPAVFFLSLHQYPHYPGTGAANETGGGRGSPSTCRCRRGRPVPTTWRFSAGRWRKPCRARRPTSSWCRRASTCSPGTRWAGSCWSRRTCTGPPAW